MTDRLERFEAELTAMRPRSPSADLVDRIETRLGTRNVRPRSDRLLMSAMSAGAMAACVIAVVLLTQPQGPLPSSVPMSARLDAPRLGDSLQAFARVDGDGFDAAK